MNLKVIASTSAGNAYILEGEEEALLIECGVSLRRIKNAFGKNLSKIKGCIVSHGHSDHAGAMSSLIKIGIPVYTTIHTLRSYNLVVHPNTYIIEPGERYHVGGFKVTVFAVYHDVPCVGFMIEHKESGKTLFLTDTAYTGYEFSGIDNVLIECNHCPTIIKTNKVEQFLAMRIQQTHLGIEGCKSILANNVFLNNIKNIVLIHLSDDNSDPVRFKKEIEDLSGKQVHIAVPGLSIDFKKHCEPIIF
jgi:phosphoribosyl 1,2-cyclic phosphodiesterase